MSEESDIAAFKDYSPSAADASASSAPPAAATPSAQPTAPATAGKTYPEHSTGECKCNIGLLLSTLLVGQDAYDNTIIYSQKVRSHPDSLNM